MKLICESQSSRAMLFREASVSARRRYGSKLERGVALVITLILLSVITVMAVTFLVVSRSQHGSVATTTDTTTARLSAESGFEEAKSRLISPILAFTNAMVADLIVSTNFNNPIGFISTGPSYASYTNVNYNYPNGNFLTGNDFLQNLENLLYLPRAPVFVLTNRNATNADFRFYHDLNRNRRYDTNGLQPVINPLGGFYDLQGNPINALAPGNTLSNNFTGDPEWIGILERPGYPHSPTNRFLGRYCYIVIPTGNTLDMNFIHNYVKQFNVPMFNAPGDGFLRNQGVAPFEINLAAFLVDLNTNFWPYPAANGFGAAYFYDTNYPGYVANKGAAFDDALAVLRYRYRRNWRSLASVAVLYGTPGQQAFTRDYVDGYSAGPLMFGSWWRPGALDNDSTRVNFSWSSADNPDHLFTTQDLLDKSKITYSPPLTAGALGLAERFAAAGATNSSYDRYTYYRLLSQLGTDSAADPPDRMNVNYDNLVQANTLTGVKSVTNFIPWRPVDFFTNAAMRLLANAGYGTNVLVSGNFKIQVYPTNYYSPSVHRLFQLAANMYDATTNFAVNTGGPLSGPNRQMGLPSVFRPIFQSVNGGNQVYITEFREETDAKIAYPATAPIYRDLTDPTNRVALQPLDMVYGIPLVVGAKKGIPNFNEFAMQTLIYVTRKLEFRRPFNVPDAKPNETNQMYIVGVSNLFAVEAWNSYTNLFRRDLDMIVSSDVSMRFSNEVKVLHRTNWSQGVVLSTNFWPGFAASGAFVVPLSNKVTFLPTATYEQAGQRFVGLARNFERNAGFPVPRWWASMSARTRFILVDKRTQRIVDYVNLDSTEDTLDITAKLKEDGDCDTINGSPGSQWCTNRVNNSTDFRVVTYGIQNQIHIGEGVPKVTDWNSFNLDPAVGADEQKAVDGFRVNMGLTPLYHPNATYYKSNVFYAPYDPYRAIYQHVTWQANDPLVHYTVGDLKNLEKTNNVDFILENPPLKNIGRINDRYEPWTGTLPGHSSSTTLFDLSLKDPMVGRSDDWEFPTNRLPNIGWLGRIHRGTPWQTVYLKAPVAPLDVWQRWSGNGVILTNWSTDPNGSTNYDAELTMPYKDRYILDLFTAALNDNASRGQLPVNQTNIAAWSAVLSGVIALSNIVSDAALANDPFLTPTNWPVVVEPAGTYDQFNQNTMPPIARIVQAINNARSNTNLFPNRVFTRVGDILSVPEFTIGSRFLNPTNYVGTYPNGHWTGASPFINWGNPSNIKAKPKTAAEATTQQQQRALNDAAIERIPQQILGLLRLDQAPRFVIYSYGQALKPAEHSIVTSGAYFGLCTNYQVTAEVATRAVVRIEGAPSNPHVVVENYNMLPAE